jgi:hypothetical protein
MSAERKESLDENWHLKQKVYRPTITKVMMKTCNVVVLLGQAPLFAISGYKVCVKTVIHIFL